jgi:hypothetical protein
MFADPDSYPLDARAIVYSIAYFSAKHLGSGQFYLLATLDRDGNRFDGSATYRLTVPAHVPVSLYWSVTTYDRTTHALIRDQPWSSRSSNTPSLQQNPDGTVDLYFGPGTRGQRVQLDPTRADGEFELMFRFYGPEKPLFDKTWQVADVDRID